MELYQSLIATLSTGPPADEVVVGPFLTGVRSGDRCGLASTPPAGGPGHGAPAVTDSGALSGKSLAELARLVFSKLPLEAAVGMAAINAGLPLAGLEFLEAHAAQALRERAAGQDLVMVGHFPFVSELEAAARSVAVLELDPRADDLPASEAGRVIPAADVVAITGSAFVNHTIAHLLSLAAGKWVMVLGPTTPLSPVLFEHGVSVLAGCLPSDPAFTLRQVREGAVFRQLQRVRRVILARR